MQCTFLLRSHPSNDHHVRNTSFFVSQYLFGGPKNISVQYCSGADFLGVHTPPKNSLDPPKKNSIMVLGTAEE